MRHKYATRGIVLARTPLGEASALVAILTDELGLVRARAQGVRRPGAKLAAALATFSLSEMTLVRGKDGWRVAGAVLEERLTERLRNPDARARAGRIGGLLLRLTAGDERGGELFSLVYGFFEVLATRPAEEHDAAEVLSALGVLGLLGLDDATPFPVQQSFTPDRLSSASERRAEYVARINRGIEASGL